MLAVRNRAQSSHPRCSLSRGAPFGSDSPAVAALAVVASSGRAAITPSVKALSGAVCFSAPATKARNCSCNSFRPVTAVALPRPRSIPIPRHGLDGLMLAIKQDQRFTIDFRDAFERAPENRLFLVADDLVRRQRFR